MYKRSILLIVGLLTIFAMIAPVAKATVTPPDHVPTGPGQGFVLPDGYYGISYYASSRPELVISSLGSQPDVTFYAPTVMPDNNACLEATIMHFRNNTETPAQTHHAIGFWDWCYNGAGGDGVGGWQNIYYYPDATFDSKYNKKLSWTVDGNAVTNDPTFFIKLQKVNGSSCWRGYLWNWTTSAWDQKSQSCGTNPDPDSNGWAIFETYGWNNGGTLPACFTFNPVNSNNRHIHFRRPYMLTNTTTPLVWSPLLSSQVSTMATANPCILDDTWHYMENTDPQDPNSPYYWAVISSP